MLVSARYRQDPRRDSPPIAAHGPGATDQGPGAAGAVFVILATSCGRITNTRAQLTSSPGRSSPGRSGHQLTRASHYLRPPAHGLARVPGLKLRNSRNSGHGHQGAAHGHQGAAHGPGPTDQGAAARVRYARSSGRGSRPGARGPGLHHQAQPSISSSCTKNGASWRAGFRFRYTRARPAGGARRKKTGRMGRF